MKCALYRYCVIVVSSSIVNYMHSTATFIWILPHNHLIWLGTTWFLPRTDWTWTTYLTHDWFDSGPPYLTNENLPITLPPRRGHCKYICIYTESQNVAMSHRIWPNLTISSNLAKYWQILTIFHWISLYPTMSHRYLAESNQTKSCHMHVLEDLVRLWLLQN